MQELQGKKVVLGYSGGPDAVALAYRLGALGAEVIPVYVDYRKTGGGKTIKDLRAAQTSAKLLGLKEVIKIRAPLGNRPKSERNRHFVEVLTSIAKNYTAYAIALGTISDGEDIDLNPDILSNPNTPVITWDTFGVREKAEEFVGMNDLARRALFQTTSCQMWWRVECGNCYSCKARHAAFLKIFGYDPTSYRPNSQIGRSQ